jgi:hypothetical protein
VEESEMYLKNFRNSVANPNNPIRLGNRKIQINNYFLVLIASLVFILLFYIYYYNNSETSNESISNSSNEAHNERVYDRRYPITNPLIANGMKVFKIGKFFEPIKDEIIWLSMINQTTFPFQELSQI